MPSTKIVPYEGTIAVPKLHWGQQQVLAESRIYNYLCAHRGWWKSSLLMRLALEHVLSGQDLGWYSLTWNPIKDNWNLLQHALGHDEWFNKSENTLKIPGAGSMFFYSLELPDNARGPTFPLGIIEEAGALEDRIREQIIYPIIEKANGTVWEAGTPNTTRPFNDFYRLIHQAKSHPGHMASWVIPVCGMVWRDGELVPNEHPMTKYANWQAWSVEKALRTYQMAEHKKSWRVEYLCEFLSLDETKQFDGVEACCVLPAKNEPGQANGLYQTGVDIGIRQDYTVIATLDRKTMKQVYYRRFLPGRWEPVYQELEKVYKEYPGRLLVDVTKDTHVQEQMRLRGVPLTGVSFNQHNKEPMLNHLSGLVEGGRLKLFDDYDIKFELNMMEREARETGGFRIQAPKGIHDDIPIALALMCHEVNPPDLTPLLTARSPDLSSHYSVFANSAYTDLKGW